MLDTTADVPVTAVHAALKATAPASQARNITFIANEAVTSVTKNSRLTVLSTINLNLLRIKNSKWVIHYAEKPIYLFWCDFVHSGAFL